MPYWFCFLTLLLVSYTAGCHREGKLESQILWNRAWTQLDHLKGCRCHPAPCGNVFISLKEGCRWSRCSNVITVPSLSRAASDKLGLMSPTGKGAAISVCLTTCGAQCLPAYTHLCVWECVNVVSSGAKGVKTTLHVDCSLWCQKQSSSNPLHY